MTPAELGQKYKAQFPQYANFDDTLVGQRVLSVHPEYKSLVQTGDVTSNPLYKDNPTFRQDASYSQEDTVPPEQRVLNAVGSTASGIQMGRGISSLAGKALESSLGQAIVNSPKDLGKQYAAQDEALGVSRDLPETSSRATFESPYANTLERKPPRAIPVKTAYESNIVGAEPLASNVPTKLPENFAGFKKFAESRMGTFGEELTPQELMNYKVYLKNVMEQSPKFDSTGKITTLYQQASDLNSKVSGLFKQVADKGLEGADLPSGVMDSRSELDNINSLSNSIRNAPANIMRGTKKVAKGAALLGALGYGAEKLMGK